MDKQKLNLSVDSEIIAKAKEKGINISDFLERALKEKINSKAINVPEESLKAECSKCNSIIDCGYVCEGNKLVLCIDCELKFNTAKECRNLHDFKELNGNLLHAHKRFGVFKNMQFTEIEDFNETGKRTGQVAREMLESKEAALI